MTASADTAPHASSGSNADWADRTEQAVLDAFLHQAPVHGWSRRSLLLACADRGLSEGDAGLLFPNGARDLAALFSRRCDAEALEALEAMVPPPAKIREKIAAGIGARLDAAMAHAKAARRWTGFLALPTNAPLGLRLTWESADALWRWAGDTATDENHYSKRAILSGILIPALNIRLVDGQQAARDFVDRRIENVMQFEKWKAGLKPSDHLDRLARGLSGLRYGRG